MKNLAKFLFISLLAFSLADISHAQEKKKKKRENKLSNLSQEAIDEMILEQNLFNLGGSEYNFFESAVYNFEKMGEKAVNPLLEHLKKNRDDHKITNAVIYTLGRLGKNGTRAVPILTTYLKDNDYDTKVTTVSALGRIGPASEKAVPILKTFLYDEEDWLTQITKRALEDINTPASLATLDEYNKFRLLKKKRKELASSKSN